MIRSQRPSRGLCRKSGARCKLSSDCREKEEERDDFSKHAMLGVRISIFFSTFHFNLFSFRIKPFSLAECALFFPLHHFQQVFNSTPPDCRWNSQSVAPSAATCNQRLEWEFALDIAGRVLFRAISSAHSKAQTIRFCVPRRAMTFAAIRCILMFDVVKVYVTILKLTIRRWCLCMHRYISAWYSFLCEKILTSLKWFKIEANEHLRRSRWLQLQAPRLDNGRFHAENLPSRFFS